jgi:hypothetical protein
VFDPARVVWNVEDFGAEAKRNSWFIWPKNLDLHFLILELWDFRIFLLVKDTLLLKDLVNLSVSIAGTESERLFGPLDELSAFELDVTIFVAGLRRREDSINVCENDHFCLHVGARQSGVELWHLNFIIYF